MHITKLVGVSCGLLLSAAACGGTTSTDECTPDKISGMDYKFSTNALKLPSSATSYAIDIDGDKNMRPDNQLKAIISAVASANFDLDKPIADAVAKGDAVVLMDVQATDLMNGCAKATLYLADKPAMNPKYDGTDTFAVRAGNTPAVLYGKITGGKLDTIRPKDQKGDQVQKITLNLPLADGNLPLTMYGAHIQGNIAADKVMTGEIHGVIRKTDIDNQIIPAVAQLLTDQIHKNPTASATETIIRLFEDQMGNDASKKKCTDTPAKCCATPATRMTCEITADEVRSNALIGNVLAPDVQVFQGDTWSPVPGGTMKDGMSVGIGFTGVKATFQP